MSFSSEFFAIRSIEDPDEFQAAARELWERTPERDRREALVMVLADVNTQAQEAEKAVTAVMAIEHAKWVKSRWKGDDDVRSV